MTGEKQKTKTAELLGRIYGKLLEPTEEDAAKAAESDTFRRVLIAYWIRTAEEPALSKELSSLVKRCGTEFPEDFSEEEKKAFLYGCLCFPENRIAFLRKKQGLSQTELAALMGVKQSQISRWESGHMPGLRNLQRLSGVLKCSMEDLLKGSVKKEADND